MADRTALREQIKRCQAWLKEHADDPSITPRAADSVVQLMHRLQHDLNSQSNNV